MRVRLHRAALQATRSQPGRSQQVCEGTRQGWHAWQAPSCCSHTQPLLGCGPRGRKIKKLNKIRSFSTQLLTRIASARAASSWWADTGASASACTLSCATSASAQSPAPMKKNLPMDSAV